MAKAIPYTVGGGVPDAPKDPFGITRLHAAAYRRATNGRPCNGPFSNIKKLDAGLCIQFFAYQRVSIAFWIRSRERSLPRICMTQYRSGEFVFPVTAMRSMAETSATVPGKAVGSAL